jgi:hypothetical protein
VSARWNSDIFQIWNMDSSLKENATVMEKVDEILKGVQIQSPFYKGKIQCLLLINLFTGARVQMKEHCNSYHFPLFGRMMIIAHKDHDHFKM